MLWAVRFSFLLFAITVTLPTLAVDVDAMLNEANKKKLDAGKVVITKSKVDDAGEKVISNSAAMVVINKPVEAVWAVLRDIEKLPEFIPRMIASEKYTQSGNVVGIRQTLKVLWKKVTYNVLQEEDTENHTLSYKLDKSQKNDIAETQGQWILRPYGNDQTLAVYTLALDTGMPVPRFLQTMLLNQDLPGTLNAIKQRAETDGKYKK